MRILPLSVAFIACLSLVTPGLACSPPDPSYVPPSRPYVPLGARAQSIYDQAAPILVLGKLNNLRPLGSGNRVTEFAADLEVVEILKGPGRVKAKRVVVFVDSASCRFAPPPDAILALEYTRDTTWPEVRWYSLEPDVAVALVRLREGASGRR